MASHGQIILAEDYVSSLAGCRACEASADKHWKTATPTQFGVHAGGYEGIIGTPIIIVMLRAMVAQDNQTVKCIHCVNPSSSINIHT